MARKKHKQSNSNNANKNSVLFAFLATFLSIIGFLIALVAKRNDKYVMFYAKQSLVIFVFMVLAGMINKLIGWIPISGSIIKFALGVLMIILWLLSWVYALSGKMKNIPIVEYWAKMIKI